MPGVQMNSIKIDLTMFSYIGIYLSNIQLYFAALYSLAPCFQLLALFYARAQIVQSCPHFPRSLTQLKYTTI